MKQMNDRGNVDLILMAVTAGVVIAISLLVIFPVIGGLNTDSIDADIGASSTTPAANATDNLVENLETFYSVSPIYVVVLAAVGIISAVMMIIVRKK